MASSIVHDLNPSDGLQWLRDGSGLLLSSSADGRLLLVSADGSAVEPLTGIGSSGYFDSHDWSSASVAEWLE